MISLREFKKLFKPALTFFISFSALLLALPLSPSALEIPSEWGQTYERFHGMRPKTLILIQEAHVDYGAQKAIAEILKSLIEKDSLRLILVEGGWDDVGLSYLRSYGSPEGRVQVAERYLREGKISGEEYLDIVSDLDFSLWGIEDPRLYDENMRAFLKIQEKQEAWLAELARLESLLQALKEKLFSPPLLQWEKKKALLEEKKISLLDYLDSLKRLASDPAVFEAFPHLKKIFTLTGIDGRADPEKAEWEKQTLIRALSKKLTKPELERLRLLEERKSPEEELEFLESLLDLYQKHSKRLKGVSLGSLPHYVLALREGIGTDPRRVFAELESAEEKMTRVLRGSPEQKDLAKIAGAFHLLKRLFELKLGPEEFDRLEKKPADFRLKSWGEFLKTQSKKFSLTQPLPDLERIEGRIPEAKAFYLSAAKREEALIENTVKKVEAEGDSLAALIVGGFHAERLARALKERGYSLVVVAPRFTPADSKNQNRHYFEILKYKWGSGPAK